MTLINQAFSFYIDPSAAGNSAIVSISSIGLFFIYRPDAINNVSGQERPGVSMYLVDTVNDVPNLANTSLYNNIARAEWEAVITSSDATKETLFKFPTPIEVATGRKYAVLINYDNNEQFEMWVNRRGNNLVGTNVPSTGPSSQYGGVLFHFNNSIQDLAQATVANFASVWTPVQDIDPVFNVYVARFAVNGVPIFAMNTSPNTVISTTPIQYTYNANTRTISVTHPTPRMENIQFDPIASIKQPFVGPQRVHQASVFYPGGGVTATVASTQSDVIVANPTYSNGSAFLWSHIFGNYTGEKFITIWDHDSFDVRKIVSNTAASLSLKLDEATTFINSTANFVISPVATIDSFNKAYLTGSKQGLMFLRDSTANATCRFVGDAIDHTLTSIVSSGSGYANSDTIYIFGYEYAANKITGNYPAIIKLATDTNGNAAVLYFANLGSGFSNSANLVVVVANSSAVTVNAASVNTSGGTGLTMNVVIGTTLLTEQTVNIFRHCKVLDIGLSDCFVSSNVTSAANTTLINSLVTQYYTVEDSSVLSGFVTYLGRQTTELSLNTTLDFAAMANTPVYASRSNEFVIPYFGGAPNDLVNALDLSSNNLVITYDATINNDYTSPSIGGFTTPVVAFGRFIINNDDTNEYTNHGNALARGIFKAISFQGQVNANTQCEDIRVYLTGWRYPNTDIKVYARVQNSNDLEQFDDEDWTLLKMIGNNSSFSNQIEATYGFCTEPNTSIMIGSVSTINASANVTGSNTTFSSDVVVGDFVKVYDPLFANDNFVIAMVSAVTNNTLLTVDSIFSTNTDIGIGGFELTNVLGKGGLSIAKVSYPHQAYTYKQNDNVAQYYNLNRQLFHEYSTVAFKVLLLSPTFKHVPHISSIRAIGVSA